MPYIGCAVVLKKKKIREINKTQNRIKLIKIQKAFHKIIVHYFMKLSMTTLYLYCVGTIIDDLKLNDLLHAVHRVAL